MKNLRKEITAEQQERLKAFGLIEGCTVYTKINHVSKSGMSRAISCYIIVDNRPVKIDYLICKVLEVAKFDTKHGGAKVGGCGMDMGFDLVYRLSRKLFESAPGHPTDGGYNLKQEWL